MGCNKLDDGFKEKRAELSEEPSHTLSLKNTARPALVILLVAIMLFALFVPFIYGPIENACRDSNYLPLCTTQGYESLGYHYLGFGAVLIHSSYYFWTTR